MFHAFKIVFALEELAVWHVYAGAGEGEGDCQTYVKEIKIKQCK